MVSISEKRIPYLPDEASNIDLDGPRDLDDEVLRKTVFACTPGEEPEMFNTRLYGANKRVRVFPKLAAHFSLYGIYMHATAEPKPLPSFSNNRQRALCIMGAVRRELGFVGPAADRARGSSGLRSGTAEPR